MKTSTNYNHSFWNAMRGQNNSYQDMMNNSDQAGSFIAPIEFREKLIQSLSKDNLFRKYATTISLPTSEGTIHSVLSTATADWIEENAPIPENADTFTEFKIKSNKLASLTKVKTSFVKDTNFDLEKYLLNDFSRRFGKAEENAFINGDGIKSPTGILNADTSVTTENSSGITYDEVVALYFSLKAEHRKNAVFIMHDNTAMYLRTLKDSGGNYLWNSSTDTIFGKPVLTSAYMPVISAGGKCIAFGDLSYYWIIERQPLSIKCLSELYAALNQIGFSAYERLDGKLVLPEAIRILQIAE